MYPIYNPEQDIKNLLSFVQLLLLYSPSIEFRRKYMLKKPDSINRREFLDKTGKTLIGVAATFAVLQPAAVLVSPFFMMIPSFVSSNC